MKQIVSINNSNKQPLLGQLCPRKSCGFFMLEVSIGVLVSLLFLKALFAYNHLFYVWAKRFQQETTIMRQMRSLYNELYHSSTITAGSKHYEWGDIKWHLTKPSVTDAAHLASYYILTLEGEWYETPSSPDKELHTLRLEGAWLKNL